MKKILIAIMSTLILPATIFAADTMREGKWELITSMEMPGMPFKLPPTKIEHCYTKEDVKDRKNAITTDKNCTVTDLKQSGNKVTWKMKCTGKNPGDFSGETVFKGDTYDSTMKMETQGQAMNMTVKAKRLGNCP
jgi:hypothetical protein